ncbi:MAG: response regulator [Planctomycetota bacterium]|nr:response regulator [Planctomycetota bacterium]
MTSITSDLPRMGSPVAAHVDSTPAARPTARSAPRPRDIQPAPNQGTILIVDDEPYNVLVVRRYLEQSGHQHIHATSDSTVAFQMIRERRPDVLIMDVMMPQVSGLDILKLMQLDDQLSHIPVLIMTASSDADTKTRALELGAADFLTKPLDPNDLIPRVRNALKTKAYYDQLTQQTHNLEAEVRRRTAELATSRQEVLHCLARAGEYRDDDTGHHVLRVGKYASIVARELGFSESRVELLELAAQLHDIGKIGVPDSILHKPGRLDPQEYDFIKQHCAIGKTIINPYAEEEYRLLRSHTRIGENLLSVNSSPLLMLAARIAQTHHEHWDGNGYPLGLAGEDIPIEGRITAIADVYDALSSKRPYKDAFPREKCYAILNEGRGTHFDPTVLDAFMRQSAQIIEVQLAYMDKPDLPKLDAEDPK